MKKNKLLVLGSVNADFTIQTENFPLKGQTVTGDGFSLTLGGKGANQAFYTSQFGIDTTMICSIGNDYFGKFILEELQKTKIRLQPTTSNLQTGKAFVFVSDNDNRIILEPGANDDFNLEKIKQEILSTNPEFLLTQLEIPFPIVQQSFTFAKEHNITTILNPAPAKIADEQIYQVVDFLVLNETEAEVLSKLKLEMNNHQSYEQVANYFLNLGVKNVLLTLGEHGSFFKTQTQTFFEPALKVDVVNTTGAGDSYLGAFLSKMLQQSSVQQAMGFASLVAAKVCEQPGTQVELNIE